MSPPFFQDFPAPPDLWLVDRAPPLPSDRETTLAPRCKTWGELRMP